MQIPASILDRLGELCLELRRLPRELLRHVGEPMAFPTTHRRREVFGEGQGRYFWPRSRSQIVTLKKKQNHHFPWLIATRVIAEVVISCDHLTNCRDSGIGVWKLHRRSAARDRAGIVYGQGRASRPLLIPLSS